jgi:hypothetical protein
MRTTFSLALSVLLLGLAAGCGASGAKRNPISGMVTYKGQPIKQGIINFRSEGEGQYVATGEIIDGKYEIPTISGLPAGQYAVAINYPDPKAPPQKEEEMPGASRAVREMLPARYNEETTLKKDIKDGPNDINFDLK